MSVIPINEIEFVAIRSQGPGGQNVNKVSSAIQLRFDINNSSLPEIVKSKLLALPSSRVSKDGVIVIKAQTSRNQEDNRADAISRLDKIVNAAMHVPITRKPTKPSFAAKQRRLKAKLVRSNIKAARSNSSEY